MATRDGSQPDRGRAAALFEWISAHVLLVTIVVAVLTATVSTGPANSDRVAYQPQYSPA